MKLKDQLLDAEMAMEHASVWENLVADLQEDKEELQEHVQMLQWQLNIALSQKKALQKELKENTNLLLVIKEKMLKSKAG